LLTGLAWLVAFYVVSAFLFARAQARLSQPERYVLHQLWRSFVPLPFLLVATGIAVAYWRPAALWVFLLAASLVFAFVANWHFRSGGLPSAYTNTYLQGSIFWAVGVIGFAVAAGAARGFAL
jgi:hypothetical protein